MVIFWKCFLRREKILFRGYICIRLPMEKWSHSVRRMMVLFIWDMRIWRPEKWRIKQKFREHLMISQFIRVMKIMKCFWWTAMAFMGIISVIRIKPSWWILLIPIWTVMGFITWLQSMIRSFLQPMMIRKIMRPVSADFRKWTRKISRTRKWLPLPARVLTGISGTAL